MTPVYTERMTTVAGRAEDVEELGIVELRTQLGRAVDEAYYRRKVFGISRHNRRVAVLLSAEMWDQVKAHIDHLDPSTDCDPSAAA